jgi:hypothetical protein
MLRFACVVARFPFLAVTVAFLSGCGGTATSIGRGGGGDTGATGQSGSAPGGAASDGTMSGGTTSGGTMSGGTTSGGTTSGGTTSGGSSAASGSGGGVTLPPVDAGSIQDRHAACHEAFAAQYQTRCGGPTLRPDEMIRRQALFEADCMSQFEMPGNGVTAAALMTCSVLLQTGTCENPDGPPPECDFRGTLPGGAPCFHDSQCQSGSCPNRDYTPGGPGPFRCGTCTAVAPSVDSPCPDSTCPAGSLCVNTDPVKPSATCVPLVVGAEGAPCDELTNLCARDDFCDGPTRSCVPLRDVGEPCGSKWITGCKAPLYCTAVGGTCAAPHPVGEPCEYNWQCVPGTVCDFTTGHCANMLWGDPGAPCDAVAHGCSTGNCVTSNPGGTSFCPIVVGVGEPCDIGHQCDEGLLCFEGKCVGYYAITCQ